jgi:hypothetical protein
MKRFLGVLSLCTAAAACDARSDFSSIAIPLSKTDSLVISQVYGGGGNGGAVLRYDYVELFNRGAVPVSLNGASIQYASSGSTSWSAHALPNTTVEPGRYFLVQLGSQNETVGAPLPVAADSVGPGTGAGTINMSASDGKVALVSNTTDLTCGSSANRCASKPTVVDLVGFGNASDYEGSGAAPGLSTNTVAIRKGDGCQDTNDNAADFVTGTWVAGPAGVTLHDSASGTFACAGDGDGGAVRTDDGGATAPDFAPPADLAPPPDLTPRPPDLAPPPDLSATPSTAKVVISQIYGAGGNSGASYRYDFVEIFNRGATDVDIGNWSIQYASGANNFSLKATFPAGTTLPAGRYLLTQLAGGSTGATLSADFVPTSTSAFNLSASDGKIALTSTATLLACGTASNRCASPALVDLVGFGAASDYEGAPVAAPATAAQSLQRAGGGCVDTNDNAADFSAAQAAPRNLATPVNDCTGTIPADAGVVVDLAGADLAGRDLSTSTPVDFAVRPPDLSAGGGGGRRTSGCRCDVAGARASTDGAGWTALAIVAIAALLLRRRGLNRRRAA